MVFNASFLRMPIDTDVKKCWRRSLKTCKQNICISHSGHAALFSFLSVVYYHENKSHWMVSFKLNYLFVKNKCRCTVCNKISGFIACDKKNVTSSHQQYVVLTSFR